MHVSYIFISKINFNYYIVNFNYIGKDKYKE